MPSSLDRFLNVFRRQPQLIAAGDLSTVKADLEALPGDPLPRPFSKLVWYASDCDDARLQADLGIYFLFGQLMSSVRDDLVLSGVLQTLCDGVAHLPMKLVGDAQIRSDLQLGVITGAQTSEPISLYDAMVPPSTRSTMIADRFLCGLSVGLFCNTGHSWPELLRLDPTWLRFDRAANSWVYLLDRKPVAVTPGLNGWVLDTAARTAPHAHGAGFAIGKAYVRKEYALAMRDGYISRLANSAVIATSPKGASENARRQNLQGLSAWGSKTIVDVGEFDVRLLESNGVGFQAFQNVIDSVDTSYQICVLGQTASVSGGNAFSDNQLHESVKHERILSCANSWAALNNFQVFPQIALAMYGDSGRKIAMSLDTAPPRDRKLEAEAWNSAYTAVQGWQTIAAASGRQLDYDKIFQAFLVPLAEKPDAPTLQLVPDTDDADSVDVDLEDIDDAV